MLEIPIPIFNRPLDLPDRLSGLIKRACLDCFCLDPRRYEPHFDYCHHAVWGGKTYVDMTGSLIAGSLKCDPTYSLTSDNFSEDKVRKFIAISYVPIGFIFDALGFMGVDKASLMGEQSAVVKRYEGVTDYSEWTNRDEVKPVLAYLERLADDLGAVGL